VRSTTLVQADVPAAAGKPYVCALSFSGVRPGPLLPDGEVRIR